MKYRNQFKIWIKNSGKRLIYSRKIISQTEILEMKNTINQIKNSVKSITNRLKQGEK
jgi:hypothetical protein